MYEHFYTIKFSETEHIHLHDESLKSFIKHYEISNVFTFSNKKFWNELICLLVLHNFSSQQLKRKLTSHKKWYNTWEMQTKLHIL
jgi:hypothetical protein